MIITTICKANLFCDDEEIKDQAIIIAGQISSGMTPADSKEFHEKQAFLINEALSESLPQGTYDRLGIKFMQKKVSLYQGKTET